ncbi:hypothetical protein ACLMOV_11425 [Stenotrophomonas muris]|uniref:hypothetical protein n=1 Tax=Stenotrophomonas TaxID=40323 RepID=UPI0028733466|nr:hypothetical protein [Stenotrophomonas sp. 9]WNB79595.1 hypothetical protein Q9R16_17585 [Stenotrophomonas sp. 9]
MVEYFWRLVAGALSCDPRAPTCVIDWDVVSAVATASAVVVAMGAIWVENKHRNNERTRADRIRKDDLDAALRREEAEAERIAQARKSRARRLAKIFDRELTEAARHLTTLSKLLEGATAKNISQFEKIYARPLAPDVFRMHERFLDQLDVFPDMLAISIVNNMTNWSSMPLFSEGLAQSPGIDLLRVRNKVLTDIEARLALFGETKQELLQYFADLPGLQSFTFDEIRTMNEADAERRRQRREGGGNS